MKYNEWRDELKNNLLNVSEAERKRVLDYYAEAYADRREAGFAEDDIIKGFGAPYDAAKRVLDCGDGGNYPAEQSPYYSDGTQIEKTKPKKSVFKTILWGLLALALIGISCSQITQCVSEACEFIACFAAGDGLYGVTVLAQFIMSVGWLVIWVTLAVVCVKIVIRKIKAY